MLKTKLNISSIPAVIWGDQSDRLIIAVHGNMSNKEDVPIEMLAEHAVSNGYQVISFDLPQHGDRKNEATLCKVQNCVKELDIIYNYCQSRWQSISLFACSIGAYFSILAFKNRPIEQAWFLSPVVNMNKLIDNMMMWFDVSEERLEREETISTPIGQNLYWDYYTYVKEHPVDIWNPKTFILYGCKDDTSDFESVSDFTNKFSCAIKVIQDAEHYFHTPEQLNELDNWYSEVIK